MDESNCLRHFGVKHNFVEKLIENRYKFRPVSEHRNGTVHLASSGQNGNPDGAPPMPRAHPHYALQQQYHHSHYAQQHYQYQQQYHKEEWGQPVESEQGQKGSQSAKFIF